MEKKILDFISEVAIRTAIQRKAYSGNEGVLKKKIHSQQIQDKMKDYLDNILMGNKPFFKKITEDILNILSDPLFTFGNAQKFVSMFIKYAYIMTYNNSKLRNNFNYHPAPMDRKMIDHVCDRIKTDIDVQNEFKQNGIDYNDIIKVLKACAWSQLKGYTGPTFTEVQNCLNLFAKLDNINSPLEYDIFILAIKNHELIARGFSLFVFINYFCYFSSR